MSEANSGSVDTNVLLHLLSTDPGNTERASELLESEAVISVQVWSEFTAASRRKWKVDGHKIDEIVATLLDACRVEALTLGTYRDARRLAERYRLSWYDAMIDGTARTMAAKLIATMAPVAGGERLRQAPLRRAARSSTPKTSSMAW